ncbi:MAG TPA: Clp protease N-terminal domain-containing protein, partial [Marmoricola sp.]|nr:Clp protease N-terminal domain-containing protein [Marmoricola sp.]
MDGSKFTTRSIDAINAAQTAAVTAGNAQIEPAHLLSALLKQEQGIAPGLLTKAGADPAEVLRQTERVLASLPKASGASVASASTSGALTRVLAKSIELAQGMKDDFAATEHLLLALSVVDSSVKALLPSTADLEAAIKAMRGDRRVTSQDAESTYEALEKYAVDLTARAEEGRLDPVIGRDDEIRRVIQVLSRRTKNNPVLIGEPGVGKTAVVV